jgi:hypothetical protein
MSKAPDKIFFMLMNRLFLWIVFLPLATVPGLILAENHDTSPAAEETSMTVSVEKIGSLELPAIIIGKTTYLSVSSVFTFLKIKHTFSPGMDSLSGFFPGPSDAFLINNSHNVIRYQGTEYHLNPSDLIKTKNDIFLCARSFGDIFGLEFTCSSKTLTAGFHSRVELPAIREAIREEKRKFIHKQEGKVIADTSVGRTFPVIHLGAADWAVYSTQFMNGQTTTRATLDLGGYLAGAEADLGLKYFSYQPVLLRDQYIRLRYVANGNPFIRQAVLGNINTPTISSIYSNILGFQVSNAPTYYRKFYGTYTLSDRTEPGWIVELYVNNTLIDYVKADASGFFTFDVPLSYGNTQVDLRFYGPWGEEKTSHRDLVIPYTFLPKRDLEYTVSAGVLENDFHQQFFRAVVNYGISKNICIGGGEEYLSSIKSGNNIPFLNASANIGGNFLVTGEYAYGVKQDLIASFRLRSNLSFEASYIHYEKNQTAILNNYREEWKAGVSLPFRVKSFHMFTRASVDQVVLPDQNSITLADFVFSASYKMFSGNLHSYGFFSFYGKPNIFTDLTLGVLLPWRINLMPSVRIDHVNNTFNGWKCIVEKPFSGNGFFNFTYEDYPSSHIQTIQVGLRYLLPFGQVMVNANHYAQSNNLSEALTGSFVLDPARSYVAPANYRKVGKGGITVLPFLDINNNGKRDDGEPKVSGLTVNMQTAGRIEKESKDTLIRISDLEPYTNTILSVNISHLENISWQIRKKTYSIAVEPNMMRLLEIPVYVVAEITGSVKLPAPENGEPAVTVKYFVYHNDTSLVTTFYPEDDGSFSYLGLMPGNYLLLPDTSFLRKNGLNCNPLSRSFVIEAGMNGTILKGLDFSIEKIPSANDTILSQVPHVQTKTDIETTTNPAMLTTSKQIFENSSKIHSGYVIQLGSLRHHENALMLQEKIGSTFNVSIDIVRIKDQYKVLVTGFGTRREAMQMLKKLKENGHPGAFIRVMNGCILM